MQTADWQRYPHSPGTSERQKLEVLPRAVLSLTSPAKKSQVCFFLPALQTGHFTGCSYRMLRGKVVPYRLHRNRHSCPSAAWSGSLSCGRADLPGCRSAHWAAFFWKECKTTTGFSALLFKPPTLIYIRRRPLRSTLQMRISRFHLRIVYVSYLVLLSVIFSLTSLRVGCQTRIDNEAFRRSVTLQESASGSSSLAAVPVAPASKDGPNPVTPEKVRGKTSLCPSVLKKRPASALQDAESDWTALPVGLIVVLLNFYVAYVLTRDRGMLRKCLLFVLM